MSRSSSSSLSSDWMSENVSEMSSVLSSMWFLFSQFSHWQRSEHDSPFFKQEHRLVAQDCLHLQLIRLRTLSGATGFSIHRISSLPSSTTHPCSENGGKLRMGTWACLHMYAWKLARSICCFKTYVCLEVGSKYMLFQNDGSDSSLHFPLLNKMYLKK